MVHHDLLIVLVTYNPRTSDFTLSAVAHSHVHSDMYFDGGGRTSILFHRVRVKPAFRTTVVMLIVVIKHWWISFHDLHGVYCDGCDCCDMSS